ncbi:hypothetical protein D3C80_2016350 [compost metagenome]
MAEGSVVPLVPEATFPKLEPLLLDTAPPTPYPIESLPKLMQAAARAIASHVQAPLALAAACISFGSDSMG